MSVTELTLLLGPRRQRQALRWLTGGRDSIPDGSLPASQTKQN